MNFLFSVLISLLFVTTSYGATGLETGKGDPGKYLYNPFGESDLSAVLNIISMPLFTDGDDSDADTSFGVGINADMGEGALQFGTGLHFVQFKSEATNVPIKLNYLMVPLTGKYYVSGAKSGLFLKAGANPMILLSGREGANKNAFKDFDLLANVGLGYRLVAGGNDFTVEATYNQSLLDINDKGSLVAAEQKNQGLILSLGFHF